MYRNQRQNKMVHVSIWYIAFHLHILRTHYWIDLDGSSIQPLVILNKWVPWRPPHSLGSEFAVCLHLEANYNTHRWASLIKFLTWKKENNFHPEAHSSDVPQLIKNSHGDIQTEMFSHVQLTMCWGLKNRSVLVTSGFACI